MQQLEVIPKSVCGLKVGLARKTFKMGLPCKEGDSDLNLCYCADIWRLYSALSLLWSFENALQSPDFASHSLTPPLLTFYTFAFMLYNPLTSNGNAHCHGLALKPLSDEFRSHICCIL